MKHFKTLSVVAISILIITGAVYALQAPQIAELANPNGEQVFVTEEGETFLVNSSVENGLGSVNRANEYQSTTTASGTTAGDYVIKSGTGTLGSIVVASSSASTFTILDANGTATTTVATLKASIGEATYTFDLNLFNGLIITVPSSFNGQYITTYR